MPTSKKIELVLKEDRGKPYLEIAGLTPGEPAPEILWTDPLFMLANPAEIPGLAPGGAEKVMVIVHRVRDRR